MTNRYGALVVMTLAVVLCSCGGERPQQEGTVVISVLTWRPNSPQTWEQAIARFEEGNPGIEVDLQTGPSSSTQLHDMLAQRLRNRDSSVDVFVMDVVWPPEFAAVGWALPLDTLFEPGERELFFDGCVDAVTWEESVYGVPFFLDAGVLYYRTDLLERYGQDPPGTWSAMVRTADSIVSGEADPGLYGYSAQMAQYEGLVCDMLELVGSAGGSLMRPEEPEAIRALRFARDSLVHLEGMSPPGILIYKEQESLELFASGGAVFHRNWPYAWAVCADSATSDVVGKIGISVLPRFPGGESVSALGGWSFGVSPFSPHPEESWRFVSFMTSPEIQRLFAVEVGKPPARRSLYSDSAVLEANPHFRRMADVFENATPRPRSPVYPQISHRLQSFLHEAVGDPESDVPEMAAEAAEGLREILSRAEE
ncbi:extracellular solute-binding protein [Candidatus Fermentibacteria bacterium]|nr:extracellular solute-binding protein [Candidatus Fermentibacteria bacterium]